MDYLKHTFDHLESHLGRPEHYYTMLDVDAKRVDLLEFVARPCEGMTTLVSAGLGNLCHATDHYELLYTTRTGEVTEDLIKLIKAVLTQCVVGSLHLAIGDVLGPAGPLLKSTNMEAFLVYAPTYFSDSIAKYKAHEHQVYLYWLIPIYADEAKLILERGYDDFVSAVEQYDPDLADMQRGSLADQLL